MRGETDYSTGTTNTVINNHINAAVQDAVMLYPFSFSIATANLTLSAGTASLPTDYNPKWHLKDARIVNSGQGDDSIFREVDIVDRDLYSDAEFVYWITYDTTLKRHIFNSKNLTGTVAIFYNFIPADMTADADVCVIPDAELVAYAAASKMWVGDERNTELAGDYEKEYRQRAQALYMADESYGAQEPQGSVIRNNPRLRRG